MRPFKNKNNMKIIISLFLLFLAGCASHPPSLTFRYDSGEFEVHSTSQILAKHGEIMKLSLKAFNVAELQESRETNRGSLGNREILIYTKVYKNGNFLKYEKLTDLAEHMTAYHPVVIQQENIFTDTIDSNYHIIIKAYEVDSKLLVKMLRRINKSDPESLEAPFLPGDTLMTGIKSIISGVFDVVLSVTGKTLDDWAMKIGADPILEHSIYINPTTDVNDPRLGAPNTDLPYLILEDEKFITSGRTDSDINNKVREQTKKFISDSSRAGTTVYELMNNLPSKLDTNFKDSTYMLFTATRKP